MKKWAILLLPFLLGACSWLEPELSVLRGNSHFQQGEFSQATLFYLQALEYGEYSEWIQYNLGTVYYALGEPDAALSLWEAAAETDSKNLGFLVHYNRGVLNFRRGQFLSAYESFVTALEFYPQSREAKINLELCLVKLQTETAALPEVESSADTPSATDSGAQRMLEYVRRKEALLWDPGSQPTDDPVVNDW